MFRSLTILSSRRLSRFCANPSLLTARFTGTSSPIQLTPLPGTLLRCPKCNIVLPTPLPACPNCHYISRLDNSVLHHNLFQLPFEPNPFVLDTFKLKRRYLEAQKICHPDAWATHDAVCLSAYVSDNIK